jgi:hypothetical protein
MVLCSFGRVYSAYLWVVQIRYELNTDIPDHKRWYQCYLASAIYAAGSSLKAHAQGIPNTKNPMIIPSDGDATAKSSQFTLL